MSLASRPRTKVRAVAAAIALALAPALAVTGACTSPTTALLYVPITGIVIRSQSLVEGLGCGTADAGPGQVYRYAAVLTYATPEAGTDAAASQPLTLTNVFDCFSDGVFERLPTVAGSMFALTIYAYTKAAYVAAGLPVTLQCVPGGQSIDAAACTLSTKALTPTQMGAANWTTNCYATQQSGAPVLATCGPLESVRAVGSTSDASSDAPNDAPANSSAEAAPRDAEADGFVDGASVLDTGASADADSAPIDATGGGD